MLIIHNSLGLGGIETFILRLSKQRYKEGLTTKLLLIANPKLSNADLLAQVSLYAEVVFIKDLTDVGGQISHHFNLSLKLNESLVRTLIHNVTHIHVTYGNALMVAIKMCTLSNMVVPVSVGIYHSMEFCWGRGHKLPFYERLNRNVLFGKMPPSNFFVFSKTIIDFYKKYAGHNLDGAATFRIGTVFFDELELINVNAKCSPKQVLKICSVGRLVDFKKYNLWMIDVVKRLNEKGFNVQYHIFGDGPLFDDIHDVIHKNNMGMKVFQYRHLNYDHFNSVVGDYDIFVGSGTSIVQAASLGVCSIVGVESLDTPYSYGYFCDVAKYDYNIKDLGLPLIDVESLIVNYINMNEDMKANLVKRHVDACREFSMEQCSINFERAKLEKVVFNKISFIKCLSYDISRLVNAVIRRIKRSHALNRVYDRT